MNRRQAIKATNEIIAGKKGIKVVDAAVGPAAVFVTVPTNSTAEARASADEYLNKRLRPLGIEAIVITKDIQVRVAEGRSKK